MDAALFAADYRSEPYWWSVTPRPIAQTDAPPEHCDVVIVGSGYTGLTAGIELLRGGRQVVLLDAEDAGWGCSSRNGGQVGTSIKPSYDELRRRFGEDRALRIRLEGINALQWLGEFIAEQRIECDYQRVGRFRGAHCASAYEHMAFEVTHQPRGAAIECHVIRRTEQRCEIGSDFYQGGIVFPADGSLHPAKFHQGLLECARDAGATILSRCAVHAIAREGRGFRLTTTRGSLQARDVIVATNGYTSVATPWLRRRVIPIGSYIIATEPLPTKLARELIPQNRVITDSRKVVFYYRLSEDRRRLIFGGRVAAREADPRISALLLHRQMSRVFPELAAIRISHSWAGSVAYTFDSLPHLGRDSEGLYYCAGFCGSGVSLAPYLGTRLAQQILGKPEGRTALDGLTFQTRPLYTGRPWFLPAAIAAYRLRDRLAR
jgi:glycine/D-amino acid oxidase-like deaminating enzyme